MTICQIERIENEPEELKDSSSTSKAQKIIHSISKTIVMMENIEVDGFRKKCGDCSKAYIGETGRQLKIRVKEHMDAFHKNRPEKSAFPKHLLQTGHLVD